MANRRNLDAQPVEAAAEAPAAEAPVVEAPIEPKPAPAPKPAQVSQGGFVGDPDEIHRQYFIPPAGYQKPKFPSSI